MSAPKLSAGPMAFVYDGQRCLGFVFNRASSVSRRSIATSDRSGFFKHSAKRQPQSCGAIMSAPFLGIGNAWDIFQADFNQ
jgi:hypothetical protein